jgi:hypothetical protein
MIGKIALIGFLAFAVIAGIMIIVKAIRENKKK